MGYKGKSKILALTLYLDVDGKMVGVVDAQTTCMCFVMYRYFDR